jgi:PleD family two-component response regulator
MSTLSHTHRVGRTATRPQSVLVVDSNASDLQTVSRLLRTIYGPLLAIEQAESGRQALALWQGTRFDLVLVDYRLSDLDGLDVLSQLLDGSDQTAVLLMTDRPNDRLAAEAIRQGAADYFVKGDLGPAELEQLVTQALRTVRVECLRLQRLRQWRVDQTERSDQMRALADDMNVHLARLQRWVRHAGQASHDVAPADLGLRQMGCELRQLQRLAGQLSELAHVASRSPACEGHCAP